MNEEMTPYINLWIAVLHAGIDDALKGWSDAITWLDSSDFKEICNYVQIDPAFALELYQKRYIPTKTKIRPEINFNVKKEAMKINAICEVCNKEMSIIVNAKNQKKTCSYKCAKARLTTKKEKTNECN
jgi:hypothetical protein